MEVYLLSYRQEENDCFSRVVIETSSATNAVYKLKHEISDCEITDISVIDSSERKEYTRISSIAYLPKRVEVEEPIVWSPKIPKPVIKKTITIFDEFTHRYSYKKMFYVRIEYIGHGNEPVAEYKAMHDYDLSMLMRYAVIK